MLPVNRPSLAELPRRVREGLAALPERCRQWREGFRQDPARIWNSPPVRITAYLVLGVAALLTVYWLARGLVPGGTTSHLEEGPGWATLYACCTNPACRAHYTIRQPRDFKSWPMKCDQCGQLTVYRGTRCKECRHWYAVVPGGPPGCPFCAERKAPQQPQRAPRDRSKTADDAEDPW